MHPGRLQPNCAQWPQVAPWFIHTPLTAPLLASEPFHDAVRRATPLGRVGQPHEVATCNLQPATCNLQPRVSPMHIPCISHASPMHLQVACTVAFLGMEAAGYITGQVVALLM